MVTWDGAPLVAVEWREEYAGEASPPAALAAAFRQGWELAGRQETPLAVLILVPAAAQPQTEQEIDQASEAIWCRVDGWLDAVVPGVSARVIVRIGSPLTELLDELRQAAEPMSVLVPESSTGLIGETQGLVGATSAPIWFRPEPADLPIFLVPCPVGEELSVVLSAAVPLARDLSGRLLLGAAVPGTPSEAEREARALEISRTLQQFDYRTIAGGVKIELVAGDEGALIRELRSRESIQVVAWPGTAGTAIPWTELQEGSVWFARRG